jgi:hypothetical protein
VTPEPSILGVPTANWALLISLVALRSQDYPRAWLSGLHDAIERMCASNCGP